MDTPRISKGALDFKFPPGYKNEELGIGNDGNHVKFPANVALSEVSSVVLCNRILNLHGL